MEKQSSTMHHDVELKEKTARGSEELGILGAQFFICLLIISALLAGQHIKNTQFIISIVQEEITKEVSLEDVQETYETLKDYLAQK